MDPDQTAPKGSSLIWVQRVCFLDKSSEVYLRSICYTCIRRYKQTTFSGQKIVENSHRILILFITFMKNVVCFITCWYTFVAAKIANNMHPDQTPWAVWSGLIVFAYLIKKMAGRVAQSVKVWLQMRVWLQIQGSRVRSRSGPILSWRLIMKWFLQSFSSLPLIHSRRVIVSYKRKYVHELLVNRLFKPAQEKVWLGELTVPQWP